MERFDSHEETLEDNMSNDELPGLVIRSHHPDSRKEIILKVPVVNGGIHSATKVALDATASGAVDYANDRDYFKFLAGRGESYVIETGGANDTRLALYNLNGKSRIATDANSGYKRLSRIVWTASRSGYYFVRVGMRKGAVGAYTLNIHEMERAVTLQDF